MLVAARHRGPGPAKYMLPGTVGYKAHDCTRKMSPAYSLGMRHSSLRFASVSSPGPQYVVKQGMTRNGPSGSPAFTLHGRINTTSSFQTPAPGAYSPEKVPPMREKRPAAYSFGSRTNYRSTNSTPAPNAYTLPSLLGSRIALKSSSAAYSLSARNKISTSNEQTPGPGAYRVSDTQVFKRKYPAYSMSGRNFMPQDTVVLPGPGQYTPEKVYMTKKTAPRFSFGIKHSEFISPLITNADMS
ncbi:uncharacterized protein TRIADDRAFT_33050 [Trichoplax adhaerens]|uniref:Uncharacterized protein n=1 Tax=Trichoplax adhaerens TaxID=10228 RepID=B3SC03_TRIAD|nr:hypothetical protein TRIADDRAFT_33050 [Trichoplax adhaerens]EDV19764.1 hypothetical protein TRIADDRAFT_33050 [Trichoplax adhaerens]|eukprot:XP_002117788.1 hypothetical protein TRIADDRAFT_33050 [Trichoplax adhaerens]